MVIFFFEFLIILIYLFLVFLSSFGLKLFMLIFGWFWLELKESVLLEYELVIVGGWVYFGVWGGVEIFWLEFLLEDDEVVFVVDEVGGVRLEDEEFCFLLE